jgi:Ca2+/H+ antiporter, TMEM165/GDT1 family
MNFEKVVFGFFILLAATLNFGFVIGDIGNPDYHHFWEFFAAIVVNLIATVLKFGDRTHIGAVHLASSLVALLQLVAAAIVWLFATKSAGAGPVSASNMASIVSLAAGALFANIVSVVIMVVETTLQRR